MKGRFDMHRPTPTRMKTMCIVAFTALFIALLFVCLGAAAIPARNGYNYSGWQCTRKDACQMQMANMLRINIQI